MERRPIFLARPYLLRKLMILIEASERCSKRGDLSLTAIEASSIHEEFHFRCSELNQS